MFIYLEGTSSGDDVEFRQSLEEEEMVPENDQQEGENKESVENVDSVRNVEGTNEHVEKKEVGSGDEIGSNVNGTLCVASESVESKLVKSIKQKLSVAAEPDQSNDSDDDGGENEEGSESDVKEKEVHVIIEDKPLDYRTKSTNPGDSNQSNVTEQLDKSSLMSAKQNGEDSGVESGLDGPGDSSEKEGKVETSLRWEEPTESEPTPSSKALPPGTTDLTNMDHRTQCAFSFSNAIMFDLDVD